MFADGGALFYNFGHGEIDFCASEGVFFAKPQVSTGKKLLLVSVSVVSRKT